MMRLDEVGVVCRVFGRNYRRRDGSPKLPYASPQHLAVCDLVRSQSLAPLVGVPVEADSKRDFEDQPVDLCCSRDGWAHVFR